MPAIYFFSLVKIFSKHSSLALMVSVLRTHWYNKDVTESTKVQGNKGIRCLMETQNTSRSRKVSADSFNQANQQLILFKASSN